MVQILFFCRLTSSIWNLGISSHHLIWTLILIEFLDSLKGQPTIGASMYRNKSHLKRNGETDSAENPVHWKGGSLAICPLNFHHIHLDTPRGFKISLGAARWTTFVKCMSRQGRVLLDKGHFTQRFELEKMTWWLCLLIVVEYASSEGNVNMEHP